MILAHLRSCNNKCYSATYCKQLSLPVCSLPCCEAHALAGLDLGVKLLLLYPFSLSIHSCLLRLPVVNEIGGCSEEGVKLVRGGVCDGAEDSELGEVRSSRRDEITIFLKFQQAQDRHLLVLSQ